MIPVQSCARVLEPLRFELAWRERYSKFEHYFRRNGGDRTFEFVEISGGGKRGEFVHATLRVALTRNFLFGGKELPALHQYLDPPGKLELDSGNVEHWLELLATHSEPWFAAVRLDEVPRILALTAAPYELGRRYADRIRADVGDDDVETIATRMEMRATPEQRERASRMCNSDGRVPGLDLARSSVLLAFQRFGVEVQGRDPTEGKRWLREDLDDWMAGEFAADLLLTACSTRGATPT